MTAFVPPPEFSEPPPPFCLRTLVRTIAAEEGVSFEDIMRRTRIHRVAKARWKVFAALKKRGWSYPMIARPFGVDHTTVLYGVRRLNGAPPAIAHERRKQRQQERTP
jgi:chromosomal replication initiation ATPase DnaA